MDAMCEFLETVDFLVGHNFIDYDLEVMRRILEYTYTQEVFDSFIVSQMTCPDRVGGHGLGPWGERFGIPKPIHEDWSKFSDDMLHRCSVDVDINEKVYYKLLEELNG